VAAPRESRERPWRKIRLLQACWAFFDGVAGRVSAEMRKGPRGGGRDRDQIIRHTVRNESEDFAKRLGLRIPEGAALTAEGLRTHRESYIAAMRAYNAGEGNRSGRGRCRASSATAPTTRWTTRGRWRKRTSRTRPRPDVLEANRVESHPTTDMEFPTKPLPGRPCEGVGPGPEPRPPPDGIRPVRLDRLLGWKIEGP
jgi:hypothetical protein